MYYLQSSMMYLDCRMNTSKSSESNLNGVANIGYISFKSLGKPHIVTRDIPTNSILHALRYCCPSVMCVDEFYLKF